MQKCDRPRGFNGPFYSYGLRHFCERLPEEEKAQILSVAGVLIFCDMDVEEELQDAKNLCQCIHQFESAPPVILVPHSARGAQPLAQLSLDSTYSSLSGARDAGFDSVVVGEPQGFSLVLAVSSALRQHSKTQALIEKKTEERNIRLRRARAIRAATDFLVWDLLRSKIAMDTIPPVDPEIGHCEQGVALHGFKIGQVLGEGAFGKVYALTDAVHSASIGKVLKLLTKTRMTDFQGLVRLNNQLKLLSFLTEMWTHPNVVKLHAVLHSNTHVLLQMQDAGPLDLRSRLLQRTTRKESQRRPLCSKKAASAVSQCMKAVCHLQMGPQVAHRDIKPGNFVVSETENDIRICLVDFDCATFASANAVCKGMVGTFSYMAPEMVLRKRYSALPADIWSIGVVCLEVLCGISVLKTALNLPSANDIETRKHVSRIIVSYFERPDSVRDFLTEFMMPELRLRFESSHVLLAGMLNVHAPQMVRVLNGQLESSQALRRWSAKQIIQELGLHNDFGDLRLPLPDEH